MSGFQLLRVIQRYCEQHCITESRFGRAAVNDPALVHGLRRGRRPGTRTVNRVLAHISAAT